MQRFIRLIVIAMVLAAPAVGILALPVAGSAAQSSNVTITASVVTDTDQAVGGAELTATWSDGSTTERTASNGKAFLDVPEGADVTIRISHQNYVRNSPYTVQDASEREETITVYPKASATVTVVDDSGSPVSGASVAFKKGGETAVTEKTNANGVAKSGVVEAGQYTVTVSKARYYRENHDMRIVGDTASEVTIEQGFVTVEFRILDDHFDSAKPIEGATISGDKIGSVKTQTNGIQRVSVPVNTQLSVTVEKEGYQTIEESMLVYEKDKQVDLTTRRTPMLEVEILADRVVAGTQTQLRVTDEYGDPATDATVHLDGQSVGSPNDEGEIRVQIDEPGQHTIYASRGSVSSDEKNVEAIEPRTELPESSTVTDTPGSMEEGHHEAGSGFVGAGMITDQGIHLVSAGIGLAIGFILALLIVLYMQLGGSPD